MKKKRQDLPAVVVKEYSSLKEQYFDEKGTLDGYEEMMANIAQQLRELAARGFRFDVKYRPRVVPVTGPLRKRFRGQPWKRNS